MKSCALRKSEAMARQLVYDKLTTKQKLERLPATGAARQRQRLMAKLAKEV